MDKNEIIREVFEKNSVDHLTATINECDKFKKQQGTFETVQKCVEKFAYSLPGHPFSCLSGELENWHSDWVWECEMWIVDNNATIPSLPEVQDQKLKRQCVENLHKYLLEVKQKYDNNEVFWE